MMEYKKGDILKLSERGLDYLSVDRPKWREKASKWRFEFRCVNRRDSFYLTVLKVSNVCSYYAYHQDFLEKAEPPIHHNFVAKTYTAITGGFKELIGRKIWIKS